MIVEYYEKKTDSFSLEIQHDEVSRHEQDDELNLVQNTDKKFVIKGNRQKNNIILQESEAEYLIEKYSIKTIKEHKKINSPLLIITKEAEINIKKHIFWGERTAENICEQGGILIGKPYIVSNTVWGVVEHIIPAELSHANSAYLKMGTDTWAKMLDIYDRQYKDNGSYIIGWFHTHPNNLPVFMSSTDMSTQHAFFNQNWHFSIVLNPHRRLIDCFNSADANKCNYYPTNFVDRQVE